MKKGLMVLRALQKAQSPSDKGCTCKISPGFPEEPSQSDINRPEEKD